jgi:hypothetical protein
MQLKAPNCDASSRNVISEEQFQRRSFPEWLAASSHFDEIKPARSGMHRRRRGELVSRKQESAYNDKNDQKTNIRRPRGAQNRAKLTKEWR